MNGVIVSWAFVYYLYVCGGVLGTREPGRRHRHHAPAHPKRRPGKPTCDGVGLFYLNVCRLTGVCNKHDVDRPINQLTTPTNHACCHQQVYDSYGQKCNHRFLLNYGFAIENNREADGFCPNEVSALGFCCIHVMSHIIMHDRVGKRSRRRRLCLPVFRSPSLTHTQIDPDCF